MTGIQGKKNLRAHTLDRAGGSHFGYAIGAPTSPRPPTTRSFFRCRREELSRLRLRLISPRFLRSTEYFESQGSVSLPFFNMLVLFESSVGFCLFKVTDNGSLLTDGNLYKKFESPTSASNLVKLKSIHRFKSTADAVEDLSAIGDGGVEGKKSKETLAVVDPKLGGVITKKLGFNVLSDSTTTDLFRGIRSQLAPLLGDYNVDESDLNTMNLGLSHSLSRFKLKNTQTDKVDTMIVQAIALLDDLDRK
ncbi:hypothetical protein PCASD_25598 [Puccinia coronata f. sp. avenae]|uniref:Nucleolar protein 58/56 N-terminal domain-containing protein n=1 Tax=Puccinia coronata f. sp. avenae TaxID=200324 RepID=A0A2N5RWG5_9BASI|nr:hypothetical protein PCASD_25598 [Puccinia coronata f. sp. avenae]